MKTAMPTSRAKTAYGLLSAIAKLALEEPKRMRMETWLSRDGGWLHPSRVPACGTVGCIGGWTTVLRPRRMAKDTLGLDGAQADELFLDRPLVWDWPQGTAKHARKVAAHIRRFQKKYASQLKRKKV